MEENQRIIDRVRPLEMACAIFTLPISSAMPDGLGKVGFGYGNGFGTHGGKLRVEGGGGGFGNVGHGVTPLQAALCR